jgi:hypothetical protein
MPGMVPTFTFEPFDGIGTQLCPCTLATATPQPSTVASRPATSPGPGVPRQPRLNRCAMLPNPDPPGLELVYLLRGFQPLVPYVCLSVPLAEPAPSGSSGTSRRCQGLVHQPPPSPGSRSSFSYQMPAPTGIERCPFTTARFKSASWRSKSQVQALARSQPAFPMMPGMPEKRTHDYVRHGTTTLFAALNTADGSVISSLHRRHRAAEFRKFLAKIDSQVPADLDVHLICDNYQTHKTPAVKDEGSNFITRTRDIEGDHSGGSVRFSVDPRLAFS